ncbi:subtilisin-like protein [Artomyces pyxidatus]|uniref:Subtilisin-like protein n=1 Tax=Artomyces pyxidatus TaxID=48021 RepID=A0ACB8SQF3_9AGAM|nr:subtilisin-like protein [Artomyces pyxidatus]
MRSALLQVLVLAAVAYAVPSPRGAYVLHEKRAAEPRGWEARRLDADKVLPVRIGLKQQNMDQLQDVLVSVSHPSSESYGKHWTPQQVADFFAPSTESIDSVKEWLASNGFSADRIRVSPSKGWIEVNATVAEAEDLLNTEYHIYSHPSGHEQIGCESYSVPKHIQEHVDLIKPTVHFNHRVASFPSGLNKRKNPDLGSPWSLNGPKTLDQKVTIETNATNCDQFITPDCLRALYNIDDPPAYPQDGNSYGIVEFTPQAYVDTDLDKFFKNFSSSQIGQRPKLVSIDGGFVQTANRSFDFNGESNLDLEYAMALVGNQPVTLLQAGDLPMGASFDNWLDAVDASFCSFEGGDDPNQDGIYPDNVPGGYNGTESCGIVAPPHVVSISYSQDEYTVTPAYANRQCTEYGKLGLLGTTVLYSSGDYGVAGYGGSCLKGGQPDANGTQFSPAFPVSCPYVTAVGATQINPGSTTDDPESACEQVIYSGGGFSNIFGIPDYQSDAVAGYLKNSPPPYTAENYNNSGVVRAYPDLSANGANYVVAIEGGFNLVFGTSASSPVVGSIITLVNDARLSIGKGPVGFINPAIYSSDFSWVFNDITTGGNQGCGTPGFNATEGWDPVTGLGTPDYPSLLTAFLMLP